MPQSVQPSVSTVPNNAIEVINRFLAYVQEPSMQVQIIEQIARFLLMSSGETPDKLFSMAFMDIFGVASPNGDDSEEWMTVDFREVVESAPSLEFLVRHARTVNRQVFPRDAIPSDSVVSIFLMLFHENMPQAEEA